MTPGEGGGPPGSGVAAEVAAVVGVALLARYVAVRGAPQPWTVERVLATLAESILCAVLAWSAWECMAALGSLATVPLGVKLGLSTMAGLWGTAAVSDLLLRIGAKQGGA